MKSIFFRIKKKKNINVYDTDMRCPFTTPIPYLLGQGGWEWLNAHCQWVDNNNIFTLTVVMGGVVE